MSSATLRECMKLSSNNKITKQNAWQLGLIDVMETAAQAPSPEDDDDDAPMGDEDDSSVPVSRGAKHDSHLPNFQRAAGVLEAAIKIYSSRVDDAHNLVYKFRGGLTGASRDAGEDDDDDAGDGGSGSGSGGKAKKDPSLRRGGKTLELRAGALNFPVDMSLRMDPLFERASAAMDQRKAHGLLLATLTTAPGCRVCFDSYDTTHVAASAAADSSKDAKDSLGGDGDNDEEGDDGLSSQKAPAAPAAPADPVAAAAAAELYMDIDFTRALGLVRSAAGPTPLTALALTLDVEAFRRDVAQLQEQAAAAAAAAADAAASNVSAAAAPSSANVSGFLAPSMSSSGSAFAGSSGSLDNTLYGPFSPETSLADAAALDANASYYACPTAETVRLLDRATAAAAAAADAAALNASLGDESLFYAHQAAGAGDTSLFYGPALFAPAAMSLGAPAAAPAAAGADASAGPVPAPADPLAEYFQPGWDADYGDGDASDADDDGHHAPPAAAAAAAGSKGGDYDDGFGAALTASALCSPSRPLAPRPGADDDAAAGGRRGGNLTAELDAAAAAAAPPETAAGGALLASAAAPLGAAAALLAGADSALLGSWKGGAASVWAFRRPRAAAAAAGAGATAAAEGAEAAKPVSKSKAAREAAKRLDFSSLLQGAAPVSAGAGKRATVLGKKALETRAAAAAAGALLLPADMRYAVGRLQVLGTRPHVLLTLRAPAATRARRLLPEGPRNEAAADGGIVTGGLLLSGVSEDEQAVAAAAAAAAAAAGDDEVAGDVDDGSAAAAAAAAVAAKGLQVNMADDGAAAAGVGAGGQGAVFFVSEDAAPLNSHGDDDDDDGALGGLDLPVDLNASFAPSPDAYGLTAGSGSSTGESLPPEETPEGFELVAPARLAGTLRMNHSHAPRQFNARVMKRVLWSRVTDAVATRPVYVAPAPAERATRGGAAAGAAAAAEAAADAAGCQKVEARLGGNEGHAMESDFKSLVAHMADRTAAATAGGPAAASAAAAAAYDKGSVAACFLGLLLLANEKQLELRTPEVDADHSAPSNPGPADRGYDLSNFRIYAPAV